MYTIEAVITTMISKQQDVEIELTGRTNHYIENDDKKYNIYWNESLEPSFQQITNKIRVGNHLNGVLTQLFLNKRCALFTVEFADQKPSLITQVKLK